MTGPVEDGCWSQVKSQQSVCLVWSRKIQVRKGVHYWKLVQFEMDEWRQLVQGIFEIDKKDKCALEASGNANE